MNFGKNLASRRRGLAWISWAFQPSRSPEVNDYDYDDDDVVVLALRVFASFDRHLSWVNRTRSKLRRLIRSPTRTIMMSC